MNLLLKNRIYRFITYSDILSVIGDSLFYLAFLTYASTLENSAIAISIISISESLPEIFQYLREFMRIRLRIRRKQIYILIF